MFELFVNPSNLAFRAAVVLYPPCSVAGARPSVPTLILVGELDDLTPAKNCARTIARWGTAGPSIQLVIYPGAYHAFLDTPQRYPRAGIQTYPSPAAEPNADGSTRSISPPTQPQGVSRGNWIRTMPGKGWFTVLRLCSPLEPFFTKEWRVSEIERVSQAGSRALQ